MGDIIDDLKRLADAVKAGADAINAVAGLQTTFDRSATLEIRNVTGRKLLFLDAHHDHGGFSKPPDPSIEPGTSAVYGSHSSGVLTGTAGAARWNVQGTDIVFGITWSVPFLGDNGNDSGIEGPGADGLALFHSGANGNTNVPMTYIVGERAAVGDKEKDWRFCDKCKCLFFAPEIERSDCAAGGRHQFNPMSLNFALPHGQPSVSYQSDWHRCLHCFGVFFDGDPDNKGVCPAPVPPLHEAEESFFLTHTEAQAVPEAPTQQPDWRFCIDCYGLFFEPRNGVGCPGNRHQAHRRFPDAGQPMPPNHPLSSLLDRRPFNYRLSHDIQPEPAHHSIGWRRCNKCDVLFFATDINASHCPQGDTHTVAADSPLFECSTVEPAEGESLGNWARCKKCKGMFFDNMRINPGGRCPVANPPGFRRGHAAGRTVYNLAHEFPDNFPQPGQNKWRFCVKCFGLFFEPLSADTPCAAGGNHVARGFIFRLDQL